MIIESESVRDEELAMKKKLAWTNIRKVVPLTHKSFGFLKFCESEFLLFEAV